MFGQFTRIGDTVFPGGGQNPCGIYEWRYGTFSVRFVSPDSTPPLRRYWVQPLLEQWMEETETRFLEEACEYGYQIVAEMNGHTPDQRQFYSLMLWLFRNRNAGHTAVDRNFMHARDFVDFSTRPPTLITPGIGVGPTKLPWSGFEEYETAQQLIKKAFAALRKGGMTLPPLTPDFHGFLEVYERLVKGAERDQNATALVHVEKSESLFILSFLGETQLQTDFYRVENFPLLGTGKLDLRKVKETALQLASAPAAPG